MDLSDPLRTVAPGLDSAVLEALARTESGLSAAALARVARRGTRTGQRHVLDRLVAQGLVVADVANRGYLYRFNRQHVLAGPLLAILRSRETVFERLTDWSADAFPGALHVSVFGSFARGDAGVDSDIDVLVVVDDADIEKFRDSAHDFTDRMSELTGNHLELLLMSASQWRRACEAGEPMIGTWSRDAIVLGGVDVQQMVNPAS